MLFGVEAQDPRVLVASSTVLVLVALVAAWIPADRVTRIDPMATLRMD
jgi:ABC-type lipoprotein release transport system permease subunit